MLSPLASYAFFSHTGLTSAISGTAGMACFSKPFLLCDTGLCWPPCSLYHLVTTQFSSSVIKWTFVHISKSICWSYNPIFIIIAGRTFGRWLCCEGRVFMSWISALKETPGRPLTPSVTWGHSEKMVLDEPGRVSSPHIEFTGTLISDFPVSINVRNKHLLFRLSSHQYFVLVPWTD